MEENSVKRVGLITLYRGYNYGSSLQAYALKCYIAQMGFQTEILWTDENTHAGRDIRIGKIARILFRMTIHPSLLVHTVLSYRNSLAAEMDAEIKKAFLEFEKKYLSVQGMSPKALKKFAQEKNTIAVICGSDQIWSAAHANVDPMYYLRFVPKEKRVAYAPSFGTCAIPKYNKRIIRKYLKDFQRISVREVQGAAIIKDLLGENVPVLVDPTLLIDWSSWSGKNNHGQYILAYFLNEPSTETVEYIAKIAMEQSCKVLAFPYRYKAFESLSDVEYLCPGPKEFVNLTAHAKYILTDSFHGTVFSIVQNKPFLVFARNYAGTVQQSSRITSLLSLVGLEHCYVKSIVTKTVQIPDIDYSQANAIVEEQRMRAQQYLHSVFFE